MLIIQNILSYVFRNLRQKRPDRAVYVPRHRRSLEVEEKRQQNSRVCSTRHASNKDPTMNNNSKLDTLTGCTQQGNRKFKFK